VYLAQAPDGRQVALKILRPELAVTVAAQRFLREIEFLRDLDHPNIGRLLDSGEQEWLVYYVMPYVEGPSLHQYLDQHGRMAHGDALRMGRDILSALSHAHERGIVHRDVKPDNILLAPEGAVLVDFGIGRAIVMSGSSRLTRSGTSVGTSAYMSPEQITAVDEIDHRSDLYSTGCVLFEGLAGRKPFPHPNENVVLQHHLNQPPPDLRTLLPEVSRACAEAILRAMAKKPADRWPSARAMLEALEAEVAA
jgi:serine/threonine-protein kinase